MGRKRGIVMKRRLFVLTLVLALVFAMTGCSISTNGENGGDIDMSQGAGDDILTGNLEIEQYFASSAYVYEGKDEVNGELMPAVKYILQLKEEDNAYLEAVNSLRTLPEDKEGYCTMLDENYVCSDVTVVDGVAYVDFKSEGLSGGSINEIALINQIVYTLSNSFEEIAAVQFTVDGEKTETLMGHIDTSEAFVADYL